MLAPDAPEDLSKKKKKDPNRLKKPKSAFLLWCKDHRQMVQYIFPDILTWFLLFVHLEEVSVARPSEGLLFV